MSYPLDTITVDIKDPAYRDEGAADLYKEAGGSKLVEASIRLHKALSAQGAKLEEFYNTPFTREQVETIRLTVEAIERVELQLERWHHLIYPNQSSKCYSDV